MDKSKTNQRQIESFFNSETAYIGVTRNSKYSALISRITMLNWIVKGMIEKKQQE